MSVMGLKVLWWRGECITERQLIDCKNHWKDFGIDEYKIGHRTFNPFERLAEGDSTTEVAVVTVEMIL